MCWLLLQTSSKSHRELRIIAENYFKLLSSLMQTLEIKTLGKYLGVTDTLQSKVRHG